MGAVFVEWLNANEQRNYPLHDLTDRKASDGRILPNDIIVDAHIWLPKSAGSKVFVSSVSVSPRLITMTFAAAPFDPFCSSSIPAVAFVPLAALRVSRPHTAFTNYQLDSLYPGVGGWVTLGSCDDLDENYSMTFDGPENTVLLDRTVHAFNDLPVLSVGKLGVLPKLTGTVKLTGVAGQIKTFAINKIIDGVTRRVAAIGLDKTNPVVDNLARFAGECGHRPQAGNCKLAPIVSVSGLTPDCDGNINIKFSGDIVVGAVQPGGIILDHPVGLAQVCATKAGFDPLPGENHDDYCIPPTPPTPSSSSIPSSSSSSLSEISSSSGPLVPKDCEYFAGPVGPFTAYGQYTVVKPVPPSPSFEWSIELYQGGYYAVTPIGYAEEMYMLNLVKYLTLNPAMVRKLSAKVRVVSEQQNAVILFGHPGVGIDLGFYFFGLSLKRTAAYPNGKFFFGVKSSNKITDPDYSLGYGYTFNPAVAQSGRIWDPGAEMPVTEYNVRVTLSRSGVYTVVQAWVDWLDSNNVPHSFYTAIPGTIYGRVEGYAGFGAVASDTMYNAVGVDCLV